LPRAISGKTFSDIALASAGKRPGRQQNAESRYQQRDRHQFQRVVQSYRLELFRHLAGAGGIMAASAERSEK
jgi:hypothetical protein